MNFKPYFIAAALLMISACSSKPVADETHMFNNNCWLRFEPEVFTADITDSDRPYIISLTLTYDTARFKASEMPLVVDFFADSNEMHNFTSRIRLRDKRGNLRGETIGQYCSVTDTIDSYRIFNRPATYTYRIKQGTSKYEIYGMSKLNMKVSKTK